METTELHAAIPRDLFLEWRSPRRGEANPDRMTNPVWGWLVRSRISASLADQKLAGSYLYDVGPGWCFDRFGQSATELADGRTILIAGEHEDSYDPNFFIYNDVVVKQPDGSIEIYGYPTDIFPPADFHTATLVGDRIFIVGSLGYWNARKPGFTQVYSLDLRTFAIEAIACSGEVPSWLHRHRAEYLPEENAIVLKGGRLWTAASKAIENIDDWKLHLSDCRWERSTGRKWSIWDLCPKDRRGNALWEIRQLAFYSRVKNKWGMDQFAEGLGEFRTKFGFEPMLEPLSTLYDPPTPHEKIPMKEDEYNMHRIRIDGVTVRYLETGHHISVTVEGELPSETTDALTADLFGKLTALDHQSYELIRL